MTPARYEVRRDDQLALRISWPGMTADFDAMVFPAGMPREIASSTVVSNAEAEFATFAVLPSTTYWLWIGAYDGSKGLPMTYEATLCGEKHVP